MGASAATLSPARSGTPLCGTDHCLNAFDRLAVLTNGHVAEPAVWVQPEDYEVAGAVLAAARRKANLTQVELARRLGRPQSVVSQIEAGKRRLDVVEFVLIVRSLGADPVEVFAEIVDALPK